MLAIKQLYEEEDFESAIRALEKVNAVGHEAVEVHYYLALCYMQLFEEDGDDGKYEQSKHHFDEVLQFLIKRPFDSVCLYSKAKALIDKHNLHLYRDEYCEAEELLREAHIIVQQHFPKDYAILAIILFSMGELCMLTFRESGHAKIKSYYNEALKYGGYCKDTALISKVHFRLEELDAESWMNES